MKKSILLIFLIMIFSSLTVNAYIRSDDLVFKEAGGGFFIYENNVESVRREDLSDSSNPNPTYIMKNKSLYKSKYSVFITNLNFTGVKDKDGNYIEKGFDIEVDGLFVAEEDSVIKITSLGFEMPDVKTLYQNGAKEEYEESWACLEAWSSYLKMPIKQINSHKVYEGKPFSEVTFSLKKGNVKWLSEYIENYSKVPYLKPVNILVDFEVISGKVEFNICALKHNGKLKDRSHHNYDAYDGMYTRERQYKGVAKTLPKVEAQLDYVITDKVKNGERLPVIVYNQYNKAGKYTEEWVTNFNPQNDRNTRDICAESDMLFLAYKDPTKLNYYGSKVLSSRKDDIWYFDVFHADNSFNEDGDEKYVPNREVSVKENNYLKACNLGNYGVKVNYKVTITNASKQTKYAYYKLNTGANNIVILYDENKNNVNGYAVCKGPYNYNKEDVMACVELMPNKTTTFYIDVILPANCNGGMKNYIEIYDTKHTIEFPDTNIEFVETNKNTDGKKFIKWDSGKLFASYDNEEFFEIELPDETKEIFSLGGENFQIVKTDTGYMAKCNTYDGAPSYFEHSLKFFDKVYLFDENFNLLKTKTFDVYPTDISYENGIYYVTAGKTYYSSDFENFNELTTINIPSSNGIFNVASTKYGYFYMSTKDFPYTKINYADAFPKYIKNFKNIFYYTHKNVLYLSNNAVYFTEKVFDEDIKTVDVADEKLVINGKYDVEVPKFKKEIILKLKDQIIALKNRPFDIDGHIMLPVNDIFANADISIKWDEKWESADIQKMFTNAKIKVDDDTVNVNGKEYKMSKKAQIINDELFLPLDFLYEFFAFEVNFYPQENILELNW
ncbi:MAG: copper amine oxidase N-terminal domain-containing protein [Ruminococcaceae bacterium]|nr:copper amine oxidase N-terminal domain-containing protein [Oscillospiraceae bacterium]